MSAAALTTLSKLQLANESLALLGPVVTGLVDTFSRIVPQAAQVGSLNPETLVASVTSLAGGISQGVAANFFKQTEGITTALAQSVGSVSTRVNDLPTQLAPGVVRIVDAKINQRLGGQIGGGCGCGGFRPQTGGGPQMSPPEPAPVDSSGLPEESKQLVEAYNTLAPVSQAGGGDANPPTQILGPSKIPPSVDPTSTVYSSQAGGRRKQSRKRRQLRKKTLKRLRR